MAGHTYLGEGAADSNRPNQSPLQVQAAPANEVDHDKVDALRRPNPIAPPPWLSIPNRAKETFPPGVALVVDLEKEEPEKLAARFAELDKVYKQLRQLAEHRERDIITAWLELSVEQRMQILIDIREGSGLSSTFFREYRRDLHAYFCEDKTDSKLFNVACSPEIHANLAEATNFLHLFNSRARNNPHAFFFKDLSRYDLAKRFVLSKPGDNKASAWAIYPDLEGYGAGKWFQVQAGYDRFVTPMRVEAGTEAAFHVYGMQITLLSYIKRVAELVVKQSSSQSSVQESQRTSSQSTGLQPQIPDWQITKKKRQELLARGVTPAVDAMLYGQQYEPDIDDLYEKSLAKRDETEDLLTQARTEPKIFREQVTEAKDTSLYNLKIRDSNALNKDHWGDHHWSAVYSTAFQKLLFAPFIWKEVSDALGAYRRSRPKPMGTTPDHDGTTAREDHFEHLGDTHKLLTMVRMGQTMLQEVLNKVLYGAPEFTQFFELAADERGEFGPCHNDSQARKFAKDPFRVVLRQLAHGEDWVELGGYTSIIDRLLPLYAKPGAKKQVSGMLAFALDDIIMLTEIERVIIGDQRSVFECHRALYWGDLREACRYASERLSTASALWNATYHLELHDVDLKKVTYGDVRIRKNMKKFDLERKKASEGEKAMDHIWNGFVDFLMRCCKGHMKWSQMAQDAAEPQDVPGLYFWQPQEYIPRFKEWHGNWTPVPKLPDSDEWLVPQSDSDNQSPRKRTSDAPSSPPKRPKSKTKTRKDGTEAGSEKQPQAPETAAVPDPEAEAEAEAEPAALPEQTKIPLHRSAYEVASKLLDSTTPYPAELDWLDFLRFMQGLGFDGLQKNGSVWTFQPHTEQIKDLFRGMNVHLNFHSPHPNPKLSRAQVMRIAQRLRTRLGININTFEEKLVR